MERAAALRPRMVGYASVGALLFAVIGIGLRGAQLALRAGGASAPETSAVIDVPFLGNVLVCAILVSAMYTVAISLAAARGRPQLVPASRWGLLATIALVTTAVFLLAYAFQAHDFRIRYVARYSDRTMSAGYLWTALWGGQDGSLLWWSFLLGGYSLGFTLWVKRRWLELQPWIFATLASVFAFFAILMLFAANPFATTYGNPPVDGEGLNPLLQNYWMAIHPPSLYMGLVGWAVPFGICVAALMTGRLGDEWIFMSRRWVLLAWGFLSLGNMLGMFWSYEELGWGGYWAWDPVENASFMPWLLGTAYLHSVMIQERRGMLKVWNVSLICGTFFLTIFGTFLTRSGLIASVHSFARSDIGEYFLYYMAALLLFIVTAIGWRLPELRGREMSAQDFGVASGIGAAVGGLMGAFSGFWTLALVLAVIAPVVVGYAWAVEALRKSIARSGMPKGRPAGAIESLLSREFAFVLNNWILTGMLAFILLATTFPLLSEVVRGETVTVGPGYYNRWMVPLGLVLLVLCGIGPLIAWRKATGKNLAQAFVAPLSVALVAFAAHFFAGEAIGFPPVVRSAEIYETWTGEVLAAVYSVAPIASTTVAAFVLATIVQEFARGTAMRMRNAKESPPIAFVRLVARARRRYGGYVVHLGIVLMFLGFTGAAYDQEREAALRPGATMEVAGYTFRYDQVRDEVDINKRALFADLTVFRGGEEIATVHPAKFVYRTHPDMPTTEVAIRSTPANDLYVILSTVDQETDRATFRVIVRPMVWWIWFGGAVLLLGVFVAGFPTLREILGDEEERSRSGGGRAAAAAVVVLLAALAMVPGVAHAQADSTSSLHAGTVEIHDPVERQLFERLLCECGGCQRLPLSTCGCTWAEDMRAELRAQMAAGAALTTIQNDYRERFGAASISIPGDRGLDRALWAVPVIAILAALGGLFAVGRRWRKRSEIAAPATGQKPAGAEYDARLEEELRKLEEDA